MARPRTIKDGVKLNLYLPAKLKRQLGKIAFEQRRSVSALITDLGMELVAKAQAAAVEQKETPA